MAGFNGELHLMNVFKETIVDGPGIRYSIYLSGCRHQCQGCQNPTSWSPLHGLLLTEEMVSDFICEINSNPLLDGVTFSGGDPFFNPKAFAKLVRRVKKETRKNVWCYTGYTFEELMEIEDARAALQYIDVLVDGRFEEEQADPRLNFRGSKNQRLVRVQEELKKIKETEKAMQEAARHKQAS